jgi:hypothetical protein
MLRELFGSCSIHLESLVEGDAPIRYGLIRFSPAYRKAQKAAFPNAKLFVLGGCLVSPKNPKSRKVRYCPKCRDAEIAWREANPDGD